MMEWLISIIGLFIILIGLAFFLGIKVGEDVTINSPYIVDLKGVEDKDIILNLIDEKRLGNATENKEE